MAYNDYFHVTTDEEEGQTRRLGGELIGGRTARVNEDEKAKVVAEQVEVVGGCRQIYEAVDENLKQSVIRGCLWKETLDLHQWRWRYFTANFPSRRLWLSNTGRLNTISYQITKRFDQLVDVCCSPLPPPPMRRWLGAADVFGRKFRRARQGKHGEKIKNCQPGPALSFGTIFRDLLGGAICGPAFIVRVWPQLR